MCVLSSNVRLKSGLSCENCESGELKLLAWLTRWSARQVNDLPTRDRSLNFVSSACWGLWDAGEHSWRDHKQKKLNKILVVQIDVCWRAQNHRKKSTKIIGMLFLFLPQQSEQTNFLESITTCNVGTKSAAKKKNRRRLEEFFWRRANFNVSSSHIESKRKKHFELMKNRTKIFPQNFAHFVESRKMLRLALVIPANFSPTREMRRVKLTRRSTLVFFRLHLSTEISGKVCPQCKK